MIFPKDEEPCIAISRMLLLVFKLISCNSDYFSPRNMHAIGGYPVLREVPSITDLGIRMDSPNSMVTLYVCVCVKELVACPAQNEVESLRVERWSGMGYVSECRACVERVAGGSLMNMCERKSGERSFTRTFHRETGFAGELTGG